MNDSGTVQDNAFNVFKSFKFERSLIQSLKNGL